MADVSSWPELCAERKDQYAACAEILSCSTQVARPPVVPRPVAQRCTHSNAPVTASGFGEALGLTEPFLFPPCAAVFPCSLP